MTTTRGSAPRHLKGVESMGRGRAKAKQTKVARQLKYNSVGTDLDRLQAELRGESDDSADPADPADSAESSGEEFDPYADPDDE